MQVNKDSVREMSDDELTACVNVIEAERLERNQKAVQSLRDDVYRQAKLLGVSVEDVFHGVTITKKAKIKYRDNNGNEWSGRGIQPNWLRDHIANGRSIEDFLV